MPLEVIPCGLDCQVFGGPYRPYDISLPYVLENGYSVYGCAVFEPGHNFDQLLEAARLEKLLGGIGILFSNESVTGYAAETRAKIGAILQMLPKLFVWDDLSVEWAPHFAVHAELGGHPAWLYGCSIEETGLGDLATNPIPIIQNLSAAFSVAVDGRRFVLLDTAASNKHHNHEASPLARWAEQFGVTDHLCYSTVDARAVCDQPENNPTICAPFPRDRLERERSRVRETLEQLKPRSLQMQVQAEFANVPAGIVAMLEPVVGGQKRRLELGSVFDPSIHYDEAYFIHGIEYPKPDGTWGMYHGPAREWEGNREVARTLTELLPSTGRSLIDLGAGYGDFINRCCELGWDAIGVDISEQARQSNPRVLTPGDARLDKKVAVVSALDFWEHIWEDELDSLLLSLNLMLCEGGIHVACICTHGKGESAFSAKKGVLVTRQNGWLLVSGHVNVRSWAYWARKFRGAGFKIRYDLTHLFQVRRSMSPTMSTVRSWEPKNFIVVQKG